MANVTNLSGSVVGTTVTLNWTNGNPPPPSSSQCLANGEYWAIFRQTGDGSGGFGAWSTVYTSPNGTTGLTQIALTAQPNNSQLQYKVVYVQWYWLFLTFPDPQGSCQLFGETPASATVNHSGPTTVVTVGTGGVDYYPDVNFLPDIDVTGATLSTWYYSTQVTISGVTAPSGGNGALVVLPLDLIPGTSNYAIEVSYNGGAYYNSTANTPAILVSNGDTLKFRVSSLNTYLSVLSVTISIGTRNETWAVTTGLQPTIIRVPTAPPLYLNDLRAVFGPSDPTQSLVADYGSGGPYLPNIPENSLIKNTITRPFYLSDLLGAASNFTLPQPNSIGVVQVRADAQGVSTALAGGEQKVEYMWDITGIITNTLISPSGYGTYSTANNSLNMFLPYAIGHNRIESGTLTVHAKAPDGTIITAGAVTWSLSALDTLQ